MSWLLRWRGLSQWAERHASLRRWLLWILLLSLVVSLEGILVWLAGRYESSQLQERLERDAAEAVTDIRAGLNRNVQGLQALQSAEPLSASWRMMVADLLKESREIMRIEWRGEAHELLAYTETPYRSSVFERLGRASTQTDLNLACATARRLNAAVYSSSYFMPQADGRGLEMLDVCMPIMMAGKLQAYVVATYSLPDVLAELVNSRLSRSYSLSFTDPDGTRLALYGLTVSGSRVYIAKQLLYLPGNTLVLRLESKRATPAFFPNLLTALVMGMSLMLMAVLFLLVRDMRRRLKVEHDLGEALAFRKAMGDSVLTGLRARDLSDRITYVNPAFCQMVGIEAKNLLNQSFPPSYWPPELVETYLQRRATRLANDLSREGHESVFMRPDGTRFPVLIMEAPLLNAAGKHTGWMSAILDVSEQRRVEEVSRASQERLQATARLAMIGEMTSLLSHELNQPLAAISSYATGSLNLMKDYLMDEAVQGLAAVKSRPVAESASALLADLHIALRRITEQAERAGKVIKGVYDFVRRRDQAREAVQARALLDAVMPLVSLQARKLTIQVVIDVDTRCRPVLCDRTMVEQVLLNLSRNGMQAMAPDAQAVDFYSGARVLILRVRPAASKESNSWVEFSVIDQGQGIPHEVANQLFTPFFTTKAEGMGLGLSLCRTVIEQHGGVLRFEPGLPRGTIFSFTLPAAPLP